MRNFILTSMIVCFALSTFAQASRHTEKFEQLEYELRDPNLYRTASGAPGPNYWQNQADYEIEVLLDEQKNTLTGKETITYTNNAPESLTYLWLQLDQNVRAKDSDTRLTNTNKLNKIVENPLTMKEILRQDFEGGFNIEYVQDTAGEALPYTINKTMMVIDLPKPLKKGESFSFSLAWNYNINLRIIDGVSMLGYDARSGFEYFPKDENGLYTIAQFYPRMCVYSDYAGWQNKQFLGDGEFALPFGDFKVKITVPEDHILGATGRLQNPEEVLTEEQRERLELARISTEPVLIVSQAEAEIAEKEKKTGTKTWVFHADSVRDFAFSSSRKFIWDAQGVEIDGKTIMAMSYYPKEGNPMWGRYSTNIVVHTLKKYSDHTFPYPYHKAISVNTNYMGMEYPMICFNWGRTDEAGGYSDSEKYSMMGVIIHEIGHNFFPMIVNSDERQWAWMDEGLNSFLQYLTEQSWDPNFPSEGGPPKNIVPYMQLDSHLLSPIMTNPEQIQSLGPNAYDKPATALNILRETVMGHELFDRAFKEYSRRWAFKHPTPADFFRSMEDASGVDLDWFWRGWFYSVEPVDIELAGVEHYRLALSPAELEEEETEEGVETVTQPESTTEEKGKKKKKRKKKKEEPETPEVVEAPQEIQQDEVKKFFPYIYPEQMELIDINADYYQLTLKNKGGLLSPVIIQFEFEDGSNELIRIPVEIWRKNDQEISKVFSFPKKVKRIQLDPLLETADIDTENNVWPKEEKPSRFQQFKEAN